MKNKIAIIMGVLALSVFTACGTASDIDYDEDYDIDEAEDEDEYVPFSDFDDVYSDIEDEIFMGDQGLESIVIPNSVAEIKKHSFYDSGLKTVTLPKSINSIYKTAFKECPNLKYIYIPKGTTEQFKRLLEPEYHSKLKEEQKKLQALREES